MTDDNTNYFASQVLAGRIERLCVIEQPSELRIAHPNAIQWEAVEEIPGQLLGCGCT